MKKIPTVFERDWNGDRSRVLDQIHPGCEWVLAGEGVATRKLDGTCCLIRDGTLYKRREFRALDPMPMDFESVGVDLETGKSVGWVPVGDGPEDRYHREGLEWLKRNYRLLNDTYELIGPKIQGNPEGWQEHALISHTVDRRIMDGAPRTFSGLRDWLTGGDIEGIVFQHPDGRMAKIKLRDFGLKRLKAP